MRLRCLLVVTSVLILTLASQGLAQGCEGWNTSEFFESATLAEVRGCLAAGVDVNAQSVIGTTPLYYAAWNTDDPSIIRVLLNAGADVNAQGNDETPLYAAISYNSNLAIVPVIVRMLLNAGADVNAPDLTGNTPLHQATFRTRPDPAVIEALLSAGADVNAQGFDNDTPLHLAARFSRNPAVIEALLDAGADVNARNDWGDTPWDYAEFRGELQGTAAYRRLAAPTVTAKCAGWNTAEFFLSATLSSVADCLAAGARVDVQNEDGFTPLHFAAAHSSDPAVIRALVGAGARVGARGSGGFTPLHAAAGRNEDPAVITALVRAGAQVDARGEYDLTPLHVAAAVSDNPAIITALLEAGANEEARDNSGLTPWDFAKDNEALRGTNAWWRLREGSLE